MSRKYRSTEINNEVKINQNGQHCQALWFCINCNASGHSEAHYPDCKKHESYTIPSSAEVPRKKASKRIWNIFKKQFVFVKPIGYWFFKEYSWWNKNK